jgi:membrane-bound inhibitor of C-type lysozyme
VFSSKRSRGIAAAVAAIAIAGGSYGIVTATSSGAATPAASSSSSPAGGFGSGGGSNARSGPAAGGSSGTVSSVFSSGFTLTTSAGEKLTIKEASSTTYQKGTSPATASAVTSGESVLVLGTTDSTTITATQVIMQPPSSGASNPGGQVIPYAKGEQGSSQEVGQIPADYTQGSGTIVSGTAAAKATEAALAAYPGGVVDRVVKLSNGQYEVHYIGVNWPHHIFVNQDFQVIGADD